MSLPGGKPPFYADPEIVALGHRRALYRRWLRQELFMVRMYWGAHLWPMPKEYTEEEKDEITYALASLCYLLRLVRLERWRDKNDGGRP